MKFEAPLPEIEDVQAKPADPPIHADPGGMQDELAGAVQAAGPEEVGAAIGQVLSGEARPEALLEWIDDLRDPERHVDVTEPGDEQTGIVPDFVADTERAFELDVPAPADDDAYFVPTAGRRRPEDELEDLGWGGGGNDPPKDDRSAPDRKGRPKSAARKGAPTAASPAGPKAAAPVAPPATAAPPAAKPDPGRK